MSAPDRARLDRLARIARARSDRALAELAAATRETARLRQAIGALVRARSDALAQAEDPVAARVATAFAAAARDRLRRLVTDLARTETRRQAALDAARADEGRRQVLDRLRDQAS